jgi:acyl-coenzyme A thioesterase PaaI-like protein
VHDHTPLDGTLFGPGQPCFGCAPDHPVGFRLAFRREGDAIVTRFTPDARYQGPPGIMHGGLVTTLADEVAAWTLVGLKGRFGFTSTLACKLHRPVRVGAEVLARGHITRDARRIVDVAVEIFQADVLTLEGAFKFAVLDRAASEKLLGGPLPEAWARFSR